MRKGKPQCKDIPDRPILQMLYNNRGQWCFTFEPEISKDRSIYHALPEGTPHKLMLAKMRSLIHKGLVRGCYCGCRGDFEITARGIQTLAIMNTGTMTAPTIIMKAEFNLGDV